MKNRGLLDRLSDDPEYARLLSQEKLIVEVADVIAAAMDELCVTRSELANRIGKSRSYVTQVLGGSNLTLRTLADIAWALGVQVDISIEAPPASSDQEMGKTDDATDDTATMGPAA